MTPSIVLRRAAHATVLTVAAVALGACAARPQRSTVPRPVAATCFPVEGLAPEDRREAGRILRAIADREGLYTLAGGIKPITSDFRRASYRIAPLDTAALDSLDRLRALLPALRCGEVGVLAHVYAAAQPGRDGAQRRLADLVVYHRASLREAIRRHAVYFASIGVTASSDPQEVVDLVEHAPRAARWRGYGYLFGYPDDAVDFFVEAGVRGDSTGKVEPRDFRRIETFEKWTDADGTATSHFVYAVPKGAPESAAEQRLRARADAAYAEYVRRRARHVMPGAEDEEVLTLLREWIGGTP